MKSFGFAVLILVSVVKAELEIDNEAREKLSKAEVFEDKWGFDVNWNDPEDGWDEEKK